MNMLFFTELSRPPPIKIPYKNTLISLSKHFLSIRKSSEPYRSKVEKDISVNFSGAVLIVEINSDSALAIKTDNIAAKLMLDPGGLRYKTRVLEQVVLNNVASESPISSRVKCTDVLCLFANLFEQKTNYILPL